MPLSRGEDLARTVAPLVRAGDMVVCLGAGNITAWAHSLPQELAPLLPSGRLLGAS